MNKNVLERFYVIINRYVITLTKKTMFYNRSKHISTRLLYIRKLLKNNKSLLKFYKSQDQIACIL